MFSPAQKYIFHTAQSLQPQTSEDKLRNENIMLKTQIAKDQLILQDNKVLRDQFQTTNPSPEHLIPSSIVSMSYFLPGINVAEKFIIDKGLSHGISINSAVVFKDNLMGRITKTSDHFSEVTLISNKSILFPAKTSQTGAIGVLKGLGNGEMVLDNVILSDALKTGDVVVTAGNIDLQGKGFPPGLVVGKIISIDKNPSALFQKARVRSLLDIARLEMLFVLTREK